MRRTFAGLTVLALVLPGQAVAGPPETASGQMVFTDPVADGLRQYRRERDLAKKLSLLSRLAESKDPRVAVTAGYALYDSRRLFIYDRVDVCNGGLCGSYWPAEMMVASILLGYYLPPGTEQKLSVVRSWWEENEADLERRAKHRPR
jgi:hypothetical protein